MHPLHTPEWARNYYHSAGHVDAERMRGRSTARALRYLADAIENPGLEVICQDHFIRDIPYGRNKGQPTSQLNSYVARTALDIANKLGLKNVYGIAHETRIVFKRIDDIG